MVRIGCWYWMTQLKIIPGPDVKYFFFINLVSSQVKNGLQLLVSFFYSVMAEMLIQPHTGAIELLPSLANFFFRKNKRDKSSGGFVGDLEWNKGQLEEVFIYSDLGNDCRLRMNTKPAMWQSYKK